MTISRDLPTRYGSVAAVVTREPKTIGSKQNGCFKKLRLNGTSLVVLSACETGVGDVSFSEGLSGLQRSLALVGARTQLLTFWPVNSARTKDFMEQFYQRLAAGKTKGEAWIDTQREMIRKGLAPHFWAPFVLYGDPGVL